MSKHNTYEPLFMESTPVAQSSSFCWTKTGPTGGATTSPPQKPEPEPQSEALAPTVELCAKVNGKKYCFYMVPGSCGLRSVNKFEQGIKFWDKGMKKITDQVRAIQPEIPHPAEFLAALVESGISGSVMIISEAYNQGLLLRELKEFVTQYRLGNLTISRGQINQYTYNLVYTGIFEYNIKLLYDWWQKQRTAVGLSTWDRSRNSNLETWRKAKQDWWSSTDAVHMDSVFYELGGGVKKAHNVRDVEWQKRIGDMPNVDFVLSKLVDIKMNPSDYKKED